VLVHHVNHSVANPPEEKQRTDENKRNDQILAVIRDEHAFLVCVHGVLKTMLTTQMPAVASEFRVFAPAWENRLIMIGY
jgi:hypothetical protein